MCLLGNGKTIRLTDMVCIHLEKVVDMKGIGKMICKMVRAKKPGPIKPASWGCTKMGRNMEKANFIGQMVRCTKESSSRIIFKAKACIPGMMEEFILEHGGTT